MSGDWELSEEFIEGKEREEGGEGGNGGERAAEREN